MLTIDEGFRQYSYKDTKGKTTVGIGFNMDDAGAKGVWIMSDIPESFRLVYEHQQQLSQASAWKLLNYQINNAKKDLLTIFTSLEVFPVLVQYALINLMFNMGKTVFSEFHTFISLIKENKFVEAANDLKTTELAKEEPLRLIRVCSLLNQNDNPYTLENA